MNPKNREEVERYFMKMTKKELIARLLFFWEEEE